MSAERKIETTDETSRNTETSLEPFALRQQVAERLAAHRSRRRTHNDPEPAAQNMNPRAKASRVAAAVAERYAQSKSYHSYLAEEAERAVREAEEAARQAEAAAEIATRNAEALAQVQYDLLTELDQYSEDPSDSPAAAQDRRPSSTQDAAVQENQTGEFAFETTPAPAAFTVKLSEDLRLRGSEVPDTTFRARHARNDEAEAETFETDDPSEYHSLDEEIAFRQAPIFDPVESPIEIPGNLIEFPRQLVAARRARPRLAEGPLRDEGAPVQHDPSQLRIFEVEAEQISAAPAEETASPEWTSILLDAQPRSRETYSSHSAEYAARTIEAFTPAAEPHAAQHLQLSPETRHLYSAPLQVAPIQLRLMAAAVDLCVVLAGFLVFTAMAVFTISYLQHGSVSMSPITAATSSFGAIVLLGFLYQLLFFTYSDATPGMRYARIGLCTFADENPSRAAMRRRILALALSSASVGLGVLWAFLDDERLGWHDRISRIYQRSY
ncbi:MAG TPA: RDD family protein [Edaphobacter sp.]